jgi:hypothetical protein
MTRGALTPEALTPGAPRKCKGYKRKKFSTSVVAKKEENKKEKEVSLFKEEQGGTTYILKPCVLGE